MAEFITYFGVDRQICVSRELSKIHEENVRGTVADVLKHFENKPPKGEIVVVVGGKISETRGKKKEARQSEE